ncbi:hypothetical protein DL764_003218 [Monosporascus ibericus]|uniref:Uncharacterized protein n=1 Tax=Monosporascus ibericus TaxID=155417 RepID=A0A4Q4THF6_9PEZI|nr:hypothetical protein DL764_003218 [Monosporascus ibericus]
MSDHPSVIIPVFEQAARSEEAPAAEKTAAGTGSAAAVAEEPADEIAAAEETPAVADTAADASVPAAGLASDTPDIVATSSGDASADATANADDDADSEAAAEDDAEYDAGEETGDDATSSISAISAPDVPVLATLEQVFEAAAAGFAFMHSAAWEMAQDEADIITAEDFVVLNPALFPAYQPEPDYVPSVARVVSMKIAGVTVLVHMYALAWFQGLTWLFDGGVWEAPEEAFTGEPLGGWKVLLLAMYGGAPWGILDRDGFVARDFADALALALRWIFLYSDSGSVVAYDEDDDATTDGNGNGNDNDEITVQLPPDDVLAAVAAMMREYFAGFDSWGAIPVNALTRNLHEDLYEEVRDAFEAYSELPPAVRRFPLAGFGLLLRLNCDPAFLAAKALNMNPALRALVEAAGEEDVGGEALVAGDLAMFAGEDREMDEEVVEY